MKGQFLKFEKDSVKSGKPVVNVKYAEFRKVYREYTEEINGSLRKANPTAPVPKAAMQKARELKADTTLGVEALGKKIMCDALKTDEEIYDFVNIICVWGGGWRIIGRLPSLNGGRTAPKKIAKAIKKVVVLLRDSKLEEAIAFLSLSKKDIKGFGISYASKVLRMLSPEKAATFDERLKISVGGSLTPSDYPAWCRECAEVVKELKKRSIKHPLRPNGAWYVADVEVVIFQKTRYKQREMGITI